MITLDLKELAHILFSLYTLHTLNTNVFTNRNKA